MDKKAIRRAAHFPSMVGRERVAYYLYQLSNVAIFAYMLFLQIAFTWAVFPCRGAMPQAMQEVNQYIFSEWLPNCKDYEFAAGYNIEMYNDAQDYPNGVQDENYYSELWIPIKKK